METEKKTFKIDTRQILVKPILRARNPMIDDPAHEAYFLFGNATNDYCLPVDKNNNLLNPFNSPEEQEWLEKCLDLDLNIYKKDSTLRKHKVRLGKDSKILNLSNPKDYLDYIVLRSNRLYIAPNGESMKNKATYRYALVNSDFDTKETVKKADKKIEAYRALGKLEGDKEAMVNFLKVYGKKVSSVSKEEFLTSEIIKIIESDIDAFLALYKDKDNYEIKLLLAEAVELGVVNKQGRKYYLPGGDALSGEGEPSILENAIKYLDSPANQEILMMIKARVENSKE